MLYADPNALASEYSRFRVQDRILLSGHSHQAWPDCSIDAQMQAWRDASELVDDKWGKAFEQAGKVREGYARLLDDKADNIAIGASTHNLLIRFLSALPLKEKPRLVTTDSEFHTLRRQLTRLSEEGIEIKKVAAHPTSSLVERLVHAIDDKTSAVLCSYVFYESAIIAPDLGDVMVKCSKSGAEFVVDVYHALNVIPFSIKKQKLEQAFITGGGYKYCQLGEGNGFLRFPDSCAMRPVVTGWFSEFGLLTKGTKNDLTAYGAGPAIFAGATYDPVSNYRGARVFEFFKEKGLTPEMLREVSRHQVGLIAELFDKMDIDPKAVTRNRTVPLEEIGGFMALISPVASELCDRLKKRGVHTDCRNEILRLGPAPYLSDKQLMEAMEIFSKVCAELF